MRPGARLRSLQWDRMIALEDTLTDMSALLELDYTFAGGAGLDAAVGAPWMDALEARHGRGELGFLDLPARTDLLDQVVDFAAGAPGSDDIVIVGIGGSALTARVFEALRLDPYGSPRLHVVDTVDPDAITALLAHLDPARTLLLGVSKSGTTLEMAAVFPLFEAHLVAALGPSATERIAVIAGEEPNALRAEAETKGYTCLGLPANVGGRFSGLAPIGLAPAALLGLDPARVLAGAKAMRARAFDRDPAKNPALALALVHAAAQAQGLHTAVIWPYGERLAPLGPWCGQLISESIGQLRLADATPVGVAAFPARGPADQHSLLQLLLDGPEGRLVVFVEAPSAGAGPTTEVAGEARSLGDILGAEREATAYALSARGRPSATIRLRDSGPESIGAFLMCYETAVALWGLGLGIDPFLQPAVGLGKNAAMARLVGEPADMAGALKAHAQVPRVVSSLV